jgi:iron complex outermembrane receptor protein
MTLRGAPAVGGRRNKSGLLTHTAMLTIVGTTIGLAQPAFAQEANGDIIVTATKRTTNLQTTAAAISVVGSEDIATRHLGGADDYLQSLPGVSYQDRGAGSNSITIRGIGQGSQVDVNSPVGTYFGETPVNGLGAQINGNQAGNSDIKLVDVKQVEVLRGPQGTLYGSGTMGGTIRIVPNAPNLHDIEGSVFGEYSNTSRYGGSNYKLNGMINVPLVADKLAARIVAYKFFDDGYYKNVAGSRGSANITAVKAIVPGLNAVDQAHSGTTTSTGVRGTILFKPTDRLSLQLMYVNQQDKNKGIGSADTVLGDYLQARVGVGLNGNNQENVSTKISLTNAVASYDAGFGTFLNSTSIISTEGNSDIELTFYVPTLFAGVDAPNRNKKDVFINEARFTSSWGGPLSFLGGLYYENRRFDINSGTEFQYTQTIPTVALAGIASAHTKQYQRQLAAFGEATLKLLNDKLVFVGGARYFKFDIGIPISTSNGIATASQGRTAKVTGTTFKGSASYEFSKQLYVYGLFSEGFRAPFLQGIVRYDLYDPDGNGLINFADGVQRKVQDGLLSPDKTKNYEVGIKFSTPDKRLRGSLSAYQIDWTGIPIVPSLTINGGAAYYINAGKARIKGIEFESTARLPAGFQLDGSVSYTDAVLAETQPGLGVKGTRLPGSVKWNAHAALMKTFEVAEHPSYIRADYTWVGKYFGTLAQTPPAAGGYGLIGASAGTNLDKLDLSVFVKNLANSKAATWYDNTFTTRAYRVRPRTIGVSAGYKF